MRVYSPNHPYLQVNPQLCSYCGNTAVVHINEQLFEVLGNTEETLHYYTALHTTHYTLHTKHYTLSPRLSPRSPWLVSRAWPSAWPAC